MLEKLWVQVPVRFHTGNERSERVCITANTRNAQFPGLNQSRSSAAERVQEQIGLRQAKR